MTDPEVFYNREDLWTVASQGSSNSQREQAAEPVEAELRADEAPRRISDGVRGNPAVHAGEPEQPDRVDCRTKRRAELRQGHRLQLSTEPASWTVRCRSRRGSIRTRSCRRSCRCGISRARRVRRGNLIVIPVGRALLYARADFPAGAAQPDAGAADRRPRPAGSARVWSDVRGCDGQPLQGRAVEPRAAGRRARRRRTPRTGRCCRSRTHDPAASGATDLNTLIAEAARDLEEYQRLTAEGRLGEAGQRLESLKRRLDELNRRAR